MSAKTARHPWIDLQTLGLWRSILVYHGQPWRRWALDRFYAQFVQPGDLAFDIGAHVGNRSLALARAGAEVVAFEPQPRFADYIERKVARADIHLDRRAVGRSPGRGQLAVSPRHPTLSTLSADWRRRVEGEAGFRGVEWSETVDVEVTTLDGLLAEYGVPDFCKIDVEGHEAEILAGLSQAIPCIAFEYTPATIDIAHRCVDHLAPLGPYLFNHVVGESTRFRLAQWLPAKAFKPALDAEAGRNRRSGDVYARIEGSSMGYMIDRGRRYTAKTGRSPYPPPPPRR